jgi:ABC-type antimicrobial peptide transport system permease subunit
MKSMGATRFDNFFMYSGIAFAYGLIGVIPGVLLGIPAGNAAAYGLAPQLNTVLEGFKYSVPSIILGILVGLLVPVIASLLPVFNGSRVRILEAMTDLGIDANYGSGILARMIAKLPVPITVRQGLSNISIKKSRLTFTVITLAIAVGAFMGIYAIFETMTTGINNYLDTFNVQVGVAPVQAGDPAKFEQALNEKFADRIEPPEPGFSVQVEFEGYEPQLSAFGPPGILAYGYDVTSEDPAFKFTIDEGQPLTTETNGRGIIFSSALASNMDKGVGDAVVMKVPGNSIELEIIGISDFPVDQVWIDWETLATVADFTFDQVTGGSPVNDMIPTDARTFVKYATTVQVEGYESSGPMPGVLVMGITPSTGAYLQFQEGTLFSPEQPGIIISQAMAENGNFSVGDELTLTSSLPDGSSQTYSIAGIFAPFPLLAAGAEGEQADAQANAALAVDDLIGMYWRDAAALDGATVDTALRPQIYFINTPNEDATADEIDDLVNDINEELVKEGFPIFSLNFVELTDQISAGFFTIQAILSAVASLIALVGALGLLTTLSMSVFERQKEIGVMRSIGAGSGTVAGQFLTEGMVVGVIAWIVGLPMMLLIQFLLLQIIGPELFGFSISVTAIIIGLIGMLIITMIASLWPSLGAARKTVSDILRYQ